MKNTRFAESLSTPAGLVTVLVILIGTIELVIMLVVQDVFISAGLSDTTWSYVDAALLALTLAAALYFLVFRKMQKEITLRKCSEAEFVDARDQADEANRKKSEFLSRMSHELRTPLNAIIGYADLIKDNVVDAEDASQMARYISDSGRHLLTLINNVLDFTQIETGVLEIQPSNMNLLVAVINSIEALRAFAEERRIEMKIINKSLDGIGEMRADPLRIQQVVFNLLSNAIKYNKVGGSVETELETLDSDFVRVSVKDSGIGISEEDISVLFQPFSRLYANNEYVAGAGVGLSITKELVERMGGRINVESVKGVGTTFWIDIPINAEATGAQ